MDDGWMTNKDLWRSGKSKLNSGLQLVREIGFCYHEFIITNKSSHVFHPVFPLTFMWKHASFQGIIPFPEAIHLGEGILY